MRADCARPVTGAIEPDWTNAMNGDSIGCGRGRSCSRGLSVSAPVVIVGRFTAVEVKWSAVPCHAAWLMLPAARPNIRSTDPRVYSSILDYRLLHSASARTLWVFPRGAGHPPGQFPSRFLRYICLYISTIRRARNPTVVRYRRLTDPSTIRLYLTTAGPHAATFSYTQGVLLHIHCESKKNWATFLRPITLEILNRSLPNLAQIKVSSFWTSCQSLFKSTLENSGAI